MRGVQVTVEETRRVGIFRRAREFTCVKRETDREGERRMDVE